MCLYIIAYWYNEPLEVPPAPTRHYTDVMVECGAAGKPALDPSDQLQGCSIAPTHNYRINSANVLV